MYTLGQKVAVMDRPTDQLSDRVDIDRHSWTASTSDFVSIILHIAVYVSLQEALAFSLVYPTIGDSGHFMYSSYHSTDMTGF